eukprot:4769993-Amphidinium_carterae.2
MFLYAAMNLPRMLPASLSVVHKNRFALLQHAGCAKQHCTMRCILAVLMVGLLPTMAAGGCAGFCEEMEHSTETCNTVMCDDCEFCEYLTVPEFECESDDVTLQLICAGVEQGGACDLK